MACRTAIIVAAFVTALAPSGAPQAQEADATRARRRVKATPSRWWTRASPRRS